MLVFTITAISLPAAFITSFHAHAHKSHAVVERASVFVTPPVGVRGQELADEITVSGMDFYCVESGITCCIDGSAKGFATSSISSLRIPLTNVGE